MSDLRTSTASSKVFAIPELVECILLQGATDIKTLFRLQRINPTVQAIIKDSKALQRKLWLLEPNEPVPLDFDVPYPALVNPLLVEDLPILRNFRFLMHPGEQARHGGNDTMIMMAVGKKDFIIEDLQVSGPDSPLPDSWRRSIVLAATYNIYLGVFVHDTNTSRRAEYSVGINAGATLGKLAEEIAALVVDGKAHEKSEAEPDEWEEQFLHFGFKVIQKCGSPPPKEVDDSKLCILM